MPRRAAREYYDDELYGSDTHSDHDRPSRRRSRRARIIEDDIDYRRREHRPPIDEFKQLHIRERSSPEPLRDEFTSRHRDLPRRSSRKIPREVKVDELEFSDRDRGGYVERGWEADYNDDDFVPRRKGGWNPPAAPHVSDISDAEESRRPGRRRRKEVSPAEWDLERHDSPPRPGPVRDRRRYARRDSFDDDVPVRKKGWTPSSPSPPATYTAEDEEFTRRHRRRARSPPGSGYELRNSFPRRSARDELEMEYEMDRDGFDDRAGSRSRSRSMSRRREDDEEIRIQKDVRGRRRRGHWKADPDEDDVRIRKRRISPAGSPFARGAAWSSDRRGYDRDIDDDYELSRPPRVPSPELRSPRTSFEELDRRQIIERRPRSPDEDIMREWKGRRRSPSPVRRRISPERDEWKMHENISVSRRPRSLEREEDAFTSEWDAPPRRGWPERRKSPSPIRRRSPKHDEWHAHEDILVSRRPPSLEREVDASASEWEDPPRRGWPDRGSSPSPVRRRMSPKRDEWQAHEEISISRRPRSPEPEADAFASEWDGPRRSKNALDELEEDAYHQRRAEPPLSNDSPVDDWAFVDAPPRSRRTMDRGVVQRRYSRERRSRPLAGDGMLSENEADTRGGPVGRRYGGTKSRRERLWTEITKDLVLREAIERAGYEFEETEFFYYIFDYLRYEDVSALVDLSDDIRQARRRRIHEIHRERTSLPPPLVPVGRRSAPLLMDRVPSPRRGIPRGRELVVEESRRRRPPPPWPRYEW